ncbi:MAG: FAD-dependent oxidoreductase, partial [Pseudomonadota bacterium]|nr:FAD-dependent oxidoreductase [Pseudomonadota bacterium]
MTREGGTPGIAVIGGGLTGLMTAAALSHAGPRVHLIDRAESDAAHPNERTTTINAAGARMLAALGAWDRLETPPAPVTRIAVAEGPAPTGLAARRRPDSDLSWQSGDAPMGYVVANAALQSALRDTLA